MAETTKSDLASARAEEERLVHALATRGLLTREEAQQCRDDDPVDAETLLARLVKRGVLTTGQAQRAKQELATLLDQQIPGYQLMEKVGQGAMGVVYKARQISMNRLVAVKVLNPKWVTNPAFLEKIRNEAHLAARLSHNNVVQAIDVGSAGPLHYFVMEYVEGTTIRKELDRGRVFTEKEGVDIGIQLAQALSHAHHRGLIHRDIKPANIVLTPDGIAKLADLGMARDTGDEAAARRERGLAIGTPYYISPEQVLGKSNIDGRADLYALGATLYHMITGRPPFAHKDVEKLFDAHLKEKPTPPDHIRPELSSGIGEVIEMLMAKDRDERYQEPDDLIIDLECLLIGEPPRLAREKIEASMLSGLAEGEFEPDEEPPTGPTWMMVYILVGALALSLVLNLLQMLAG